MRASVHRRALATALALAGAAGGAGVSSAAAADWSVKRIAPIVGGASLGSLDRRFSLGFSCSPDPNKLVVLSLFLSVPRGWQATEPSIRFIADGVPMDLEMSPSEDGVTISDALYGNSIGVTRELARTLMSARTIAVEGPRQKGRIPSTTSFEAAGTPQAHAALDGLCSSLGPWATATSAAAPIASSPPSPSGQAPAAPPVKVTTGRYVFEATRKEPWKSTWRSLTEQAPRWLKNQNGPASPSVAETVDGETFEHFEICMAHACDESNAEFLFAPDGTRGYGVAVERNGAQWMGSPPPAVAGKLASYFPAGRRPALPSFAQAPLPAAAAPSPSGAAALPQISSALQPLQSTLQPATPAPLPPAPPPATAAPPSTMAALPPAAAAPPVADPVADPASPVAVGVRAVRAGSSVDGYAILRKAAEEGDARAMANVGIMLLYGTGTPRDERSGLTWLRRAADAGEPFGHLGLAIAASTGLGMSKDLDVAKASIRQILNSAAAPEALPLLLAIPSSGLAPGTAYDQVLAEQKRICALIRPTGHRGGTLSCQLRDSAPDFQAAAAAALRRKPWTAGRSVEALYVPDFFADRDDVLRNNLSDVHEQSRGYDKYDLKAYLRAQGLSLDRDAPQGATAATPQ
ncbi:Ivy family c-type lysozyme inhibitor [uncultured Alsobacter sp.]|uniref:Ivy family c-type lysozyme inhibitor n=1 Tax=uncultured Alsobacter sp. TaxID=1748258 RepID=UPI0025EE9AB5|nr:Ivy family c-type lysozyme inhibitor [uncultured Alsobacter sp.]